MRAVMVKICGPTQTPFGITDMITALIFDEHLSLRVCGAYQSFSRSLLRWGSIFCLLCVALLWGELHLQGINKDDLHQDLYYMWYGPVIPALHFVCVGIWHPRTAQVLKSACASGDQEKKRWERPQFEAAELQFPHPTCWELSVGALWVFISSSSTISATLWVRGQRGV